MKKVIVVVFVVFAVLALFVGQASAASPAKFSEQHVTGLSEGNHELDCLVIRPWSDKSGPGNREYPVIAWANGWSPAAELPDATPTIEGYKPGLIEWALDGPYIVIAANAWSARESDMLLCLQWLVDQNTTDGSEYEGVVNTAKKGLAGHSQGGGAVIKAGDGGAKGFDFNFDITATIPMNPFGPDWVDPGNQDGPMMLLGGTDDTTTPVSGLVWSFEAVWDAIKDKENGPGGLLAVVDGGTHNDQAWGPADEDGNTLTTEAAAGFDFGEYQEVTELWWQIFLNDNVKKVAKLKQLLDRDPWTKFDSANFPVFTEVGTLFTCTEEPANFKLFDGC